MRRRRCNAAIAAAIRCASMKLQQGAERRLRRRHITIASPGRSVIDGDRSAGRRSILLTLNSSEPSIFRRDRQLLGREQRDHAAALVGDHDLFLDARRRIAVGRRTVGLECEHHAFLDLRRVIHRDHARDDRPLMQSQTEAVGSENISAAMPAGAVHFAQFWRP